jgi:hypothetical protein
MKSAISVMILSIALMLFVSCGGGSDNPNVKKDANPNADYKFTYSPYQNIKVVDREAYNYVFNVVVNKLVFYVKDTMRSYPELIGVVFELQDTGGKKQFNDMMDFKAERGWSIFESDAVPVADQDINNLNGGTGDDKLVHSPKAKFILRVTDNKAVVFVRYWILQYRTYNFIYNLEKKGNWVITSTEEPN